MQPTPDLLAVLALVGLPFAGAAATPLVYRVAGERTAYFAAAIAFVCFGLAASQYGTKGAVAIGWVSSIEPAVSLRFYVDGLALLISFLASGVGVLIFTYSRGYMHGEPGQMKYYATLLAFMGSMLGVALAGDLVALFVFWELTSVASFLLIGHYRGERSARYAARKSMIITVGGGLFMLVGFVLLANVAGTYSIAEMLHHSESVRHALREAGLLVPVVGLLGIGAAAKSAQVPLHVWLPDAMEAPTPVSAFLHSATMVKAGVYLVGRFRPLLLTEEWTLLFAVMGLLTMTVAAILAVTATDIKQLLAYSTASHLGLIVAGFGFATVYGAETGSFHILNHATFKAPLFLVAGIVAHEAGTRDIRELGGLWRDLPVTAAVTVVAALGMAGLPPFNGFYSKELLFEAAWEFGAHAGGLAWLAPVVAVFGSVFTFLYSVRFLMLFFGEKPEGLDHVHAPPVAMRVPPVLLAAFALTVGLGGVAASFGVHLTPVESFVGTVVDATAAGGHGGGGHGGFSYYVPTHLTPALTMSLVTIGLGAAVYPQYGRLHRGLRAGLAAAPPLRADWWYDSAVFGLNRLSVAVEDAVQTGLLRTYAWWTFAGMAALSLGGYLAASVELSGIAVTLPLSLIIVLVTAVGAAAAVTFSPSHVAGVLTLSILGFMVAIFYILASAPDLALTQLVVETLVLVIFLLVLDRLPAFYGDWKGHRVARDAALSVFVGVAVAASVLLSTAGEADQVIADYFVENAVPKGGGGNIVNVILVDFRAFDTLGEIAVVALAAISVLTLVAMRERGETQ
ncbi:hydrogen gas-evolving membrane-bound hydrogenase subunit E [Halospeciosus flavus]|uniref:Hydrogen gas-evolving membrane-bound hydrogenase subunit E n=1 Tax=Halospeciosus flavus TaxID=3032283 RepID=A0ABD5Z536_9EURY|nr:hydrogen gas-evolving membrane-bound hydrogenase subunit E [Halospeciosus flavus]